MFQSAFKYMYNNLSTYCIINLHVQKIEQNISRTMNDKIAITCNLNYIRLHHNIYAILSMRCRESRCGKGLSAFKVRGTEEKRALKKANGTGRWTEVAADNTARYKDRMCIEL